MSKARSSPSGAKPPALAQFIVVSKRGAKPAGTSAAQVFAASGINCAYGTSTTVRAGWAPRRSIRACRLCINDRRTPAASCVGAITFIGGGGLSTANAWTLFLSQFSDCTAPP